jgi:hypothetical protein
MKKRKKKPEPMPHLRIGCFPFVLRYCDSQEQYDAEVPALSVNYKPGENFLQSHHAAAAHRLYDKDGDVSFLITVNSEYMRTLARPVQYGLLAHEALHVIDELYAHIAEKQHGDEFTAYQLQEIVTWLGHNWEATV